MKTCQALNRFKKNILDTLFPRFCLGCGREGQYICPNCEIFLSEINLWVSDIWMSDTPHLLRGVGHPKYPVVSVWEYEGIVEKAIQAIKFHGCYDIINELVEKAMKKIEFDLPRDMIITHVPMWRKRERQRGFNQSALIARKLGQLLGLAEQPLLEKARDNRSQVGLGPKEREENVRGVFCLSQARLDSNNVLLVDDVYTTGATMNECVRVLKKAGVKNVWGFTIARKMNI